MPSPSTSLSTLRPDIAGSFMEWEDAMDRQGFIAHRVLPVFEAAKQSGKFGRIPIEQLLQTRDTRRTPGSGYSRGTFTFTDENYACDEHGTEEPIDDREAKMYSDYFDAEVVAALRAFSVVLRTAEQRAQNLVFNPTVWTGGALTTAVGNEWDDAANATPIADVEAAVQKVYDNSGLWPNALVINRKVFRNLRLTADVKSAIAASGAGNANKLRDITTDMLRAVFDLDHVIVSGSTENTANKGQAASLSPIWSGEYAMVCKVATSNDIREPCIGRTFHWGEDGSTIGGTVETYRDETIRGDVVRVRHDVDEKRLYTEAGHLLSNIST